MESDLPIQTVIINNTNQTGGSNVGIVNHLVPEGRKLSDKQVSELAEAIKPFVKESKLSISSAYGDRESMALAKQIANATNTWGRNLPVNVLMSPDIAEGIKISVKDVNAAPPIAGALFNTLKKFGLIVTGYSDPGITDNSVNLLVEYQPKKK